MADKKEVTLYTDGGARGNPGPAAIGYVIYDAEGTRIAELGKSLGSTTNNVAEYAAVVYGLQEALFLQAKIVKIVSDSELVVKQMAGEYRVKDPDLKFLFDIAQHLLKYFDTWHIEHVKRADNKEADKLVNQALNLSAIGKEIGGTAGQAKNGQQEFF